jgi:uncharacterized MnhB-related membrane protein
MGTIVRASSTERDVPARSAIVACVTQRSGQVMVLAVAIPGLHEGILKTIFVDTWISLSLFGLPAGGFKLTLIDLIILALIALAVNAIAQWLTKQKIGNLWAGMAVTILGTFVILTFVRLSAPLDFQIEDVAIIAALIGSIIIGVFYVLIRERTSKQKS